MSAIVQDPGFQTSSQTANPVAFVDRRGPVGAPGTPARERRQFTNSHEELSPDAAELAHAIDQYKLSHRRRFITFEEMLDVVKSLGYSRS